MHLDDLLQCVAWSRLHGYVGANNVLASCLHNNITINLSQSLQCLAGVVGGLALASLGARLWLRKQSANLITTAAVILLYRVPASPGELSAMLAGHSVCVRITLCAVV